MSAYLDGELAVQLRRRMEEHLAECVECRGLIGSLRLLVTALHRLPACERGADPVRLAVAVRARLSVRQPPAP